MGPESLHILVLQGPNLNLLGRREPETYGHTTLGELQAQLDVQAQALGVRLSHFQSNHEGGLIDRIHQAMDEGIAGILINPGGFTHTSVALRDALAGSDLPFVEVHISNVHARESFRHRSLLADLASGQVLGFGLDSYRLGLEGLVRSLGAPRA
ncbi:MAG: type II 3-dehydroquinate dehydratase [Myxococcota bacterium]|nr:type II 3-dehydroquinate dehydratase [Myxococcota bacterium]